MPLHLACIGHQTEIRIALHLKGERILFRAIVTRKESFQASSPARRSKGAKFSFIRPFSTLRKSRI